MFSAGQIRDRARLLSHEMKLAERVAQARPDLGLPNAVFLTGPDFLTVDKLSVAPPAMTDGFTVPGQPLPPFNLPRLPLFSDHSPMQAPSAFDSEVRDETPLGQLMSLPSADAENRTEPLSFPSEDSHAPMLEPVDVVPLFAAEKISAQNILRGLMQRIAEGDDAAFGELQNLATSEEPASTAARLMLNEYGVFAQELMEAPDRMVFARTADPFIKRVYDGLLTELLTGKSQFDAIFRQRLVLVADVLASIVMGIDRARGLASPNEAWWSDKDAELIMHHGPMRTIGALGRAGSEFFHRVSPGLSAFGFAGGAAPDDRDGIKILGAVIEAVVRNLLPLHAQGIAIEIAVPRDVSFSEDSRTGEAEHEVVVTALTELLNNAVKNMDPEKSQRFVRVEWSPATQELMVADNGIGIADTERVWRGDESAREKRNDAEGTGQGLGAIRKSLESIGWEITVESTVGEGTTFFLRRKQETALAENRTEPMSLPAGTDQNPMLEPEKSEQIFAASINSLTERDLGNPEKVLPAVVELLPDGPMRTRLAAAWFHWQNQHADDANPYWEMNRSDILVSAALERATPEEMALIPEPLAQALRQQRRHQYQHAVGYQNVADYEQIVWEEDVPHPLWARVPAEFWAEHGITIAFDASQIAVNTNYDGLVFQGLSVGEAVARLDALEAGSGQHLLANLQQVGGRDALEHYLLAMEAVLADRAAKNPDTPFDPLLVYINVARIGSEDIARFLNSEALTYEPSSDRKPDIFYAYAEMTEILRTKLLQPIDEAQLSFFVQWQLLRAGWNRFVPTMYRPIRETDAVMAEFAQFSQP